MLKLPMGWAQSAPIARKTGSTRRCFITMVLTNCRAASDVRRIVFTAMKRVITVQDVPGGGELRVPVGTIITPSAREVAAGPGAGERPPRGGGGPRADREPPAWRGLSVCRFPTPRDALGGMARVPGEAKRSAPYTCSII